jgi:hypothetical protein
LGAAQNIATTATELQAIQDAINTAAEVSGDVVKVADVIEEISKSAHST